MYRVIELYSISTVQTLAGLPMFCSSTYWATKSPEAGLGGASPVSHSTERFPRTKYIVPGHPRLIPRLSVDLQTLDVRRRASTTAGRHYVQRLAILEANLHRVEPWRENEKCGLARHRP
jgi:hypothetical protein